MNDILNDIEWSESNKAALVISSISLVLGIFLTELGMFTVLFGSIIPLLMLLLPWFWVWEVPRKYMFKEASEESVIVFAWVGVVSNFIYCLYKILA
jgi:hypothetical protein